MKISPQDQPKAIAMVVVIVICFVLIGNTVLKYRAEQSKAPKTEVANFVAGNPVQTAALEPQNDPTLYVKNIEHWSQPPMTTSGDPFREVLPKDVAARLHSRMPVSQPRSEISGQLGGSTPVNPTLPDAKAMIDFPEVKVQGVIVDTSDGTPTNWAVLNVNNQVSYAKAGDVVGNGIKIERVTELGVWIQAAKEHAFIEISKSYKPNGMAPPAPPKPAAHGRRSHRSR